MTPDLFHCRKIAVQSNLIAGSQVVVYAMTSHPHMQPDLRYSARSGLCATRPGEGIKRRNQLGIKRRNQLGLAKESAFMLIVLILRKFLGVAGYST